MDDECLSLTWNNHGATYKQMLNLLRIENILTDCTLACDGQKFSVHRLVLVTCSEFFKTLLGDVPCQYPIVYLKGIDGSEMQSLIDFMYLGKIDVPQKDVHSLLSTAEALQIKGLGVLYGDKEENSKKSPKRKRLPKSNAKVFDNSTISENEKLSSPLPKYGAFETICSDEDNYPSAKACKIDWTGIASNECTPITEADLNKESLFAQNKSKIDPISTNLSGNESILGSIFKSSPINTIHSSRLSSTHSSVPSSNYSSTHSSMPSTHLSMPSAHSSTLSTHSSMPPTHSSMPPTHSSMPSTPSSIISSTSTGSSFMHSISTARNPKEESVLTTLTPLRAHFSDHSKFLTEPGTLQDSLDPGRNVTAYVKNGSSACSLEESYENMQSEIKEEALDYRRCSTAEFENSSPLCQKIPPSETEVKDGDQIHIPSHISDNRTKNSNFQMSFPQDENAENGVETARPYMCPICRKSFAKVAILKRHHLAHFRPYNCHLCPRSFTRREVLAEHVLEHNGADLRLPCPVCKMTIKRKRNLQAHIKVKHPEYHKQKSAKHETLC